MIVGYLFMIYGYSSSFCSLDSSYLLEGLFNPWFDLLHSVFETLINLILICFGYFYLLIVLLINSWNEALCEFEILVFLLISLLRISLFPSILMILKAFLTNFQINFNNHKVFAYLPNRFSIIKIKKNKKNKKIFNLHHSFFKLIIFRFSWFWKSGLILQI